MDDSEYQKIRKELLAKEEADEKRRRTARVVFTVIIILNLIIGNALVYHLDDRFMHPATNIVSVIILVYAITKR